MSQEQPRKEDEQEEQRPVKYGDLFNVEGDLAHKTVAPMDAAMMQAAENAILGGTQKGGAAAAMQSAAMRNEKAGLVSHGDMTDAAAGDRGISITETDLQGRRVISESVGGQVPL